MKTMRSMQERFDLLKHPNVLILDFRRFEEKINGENRYIYLAMRQFVYQSLQEKLRFKIPKLSMSEKKWLALQVLCAVSQIHEKTMVHGDIKPENILITSYNQIFITDMVSCKPSYFKNDELRKYNHYFGEL